MTDMQIVQMRAREFQDVDGGMGMMCECGCKCRAKYGICTVGCMPRLDYAEAVLVDCMERFWCSRWCVLESGCFEICGCLRRSYGRVQDDIQTSVPE